MTAQEDRLRRWLAAQAPADLPAGLAERVRRLPSARRRGGRWAELPLGWVTRMQPRAVAILLVLILAAIALTTGALVIVGTRPVQPTTEGVFEAGPRLDRVRLGHSATLLDDGRVLIAGGWDGGALASALLYDPKADTFLPTGSMAVPRESHTAVRLADGRVLVVGGDDAGDEASATTAEIFDPRTGAFSQTAPAPAPWVGGVPIALPDGRVLFVGMGGPRAAIYDPATGMFSTMPVPDPGSWPAVALLADGRDVLIVSAGRPGDDQPTGSPAWLLDVVTGETRSAGELRYASVPLHGKGEPQPFPRENLSAVLLVDGRVLLVGGFAKTDGPNPTDLVDLYDPTTNSIDPASPLVVARSRSSVTRLADGRVLIAGGETSPATYRGKLPFWTPTATAEVYDPVTGVFSLTGSLTEARLDHSATLLGDGRVLLVGGEMRTSTELFRTGAPT